MHWGVNKTGLQIMREPAIAKENTCKYIKAEKNASPTSFQKYINRANEAQGMSKSNLKAAGEIICVCEFQSTHQVQTCSSLCVKYLRSSRYCMNTSMSLCCLSMTPYDYFRNFKKVNKNTLGSECCKSYRWKKTFPLYSPKDFLF